MRTRVLGLVLIGLGSFMLVAALAVQVVLAPSLVKLPLDQETVAQAQGTDVEWWNFDESVQETGLETVVNQELAGDPASVDADEDVAVWKFGSSIVDTEGRVLNHSEFRACLDRAEAVALDDCDSANGDPVTESAAPTSGLTVTFPFSTEKKTYEYYNVQTGRTWPAEYTGTEEIQGLTVYRFEVEVPETVVRPETALPGPMAGGAAGTSVDAEIVYTNHRTMWVEPKSGLVVSAQEEPESFVRTMDGDRGVTIISGEFRATEETVDEGVQRAEDTRGQITLIGTVVPLVLLALGVVLFALGVLLVVRNGHRAQHRYDDDQAEPTELVFADR